MTYKVRRKTNAIYFLAASMLLLLLTWKLSGFRTAELVTKRAPVDGRERCNTVLQQLKWLKTQPNEKVS